MARLKHAEQSNELWQCPACGKPNAVHVTKTYTADKKSVIVKIETQPDVRHLKCAFCGWERDWGLFNGDMDNGDHLRDFDYRDFHVEVSE